MYMTILVNGQAVSGVLQAENGTLWSPPAVNTPSSGYLPVIAVSCTGCADIYGSIGTCSQFWTA